MKRRVAVTGIGLCTPVGHEIDEFWRNLQAGHSGIGPITLFDAGSLPVRIGGEVRCLAIERITREFPEALPVTDRKIWLGLDAASRALSDSALPGSEIQNAMLSVGVSLESFPFERLVPFVSSGDLESVFAQADVRLQSPLDRLTHLLGDHFDMSGGWYTNCSACAAGAQSIGESFRRVRDGSAEIALAGAADSTLNFLGLGGFTLLRILSTDNERPTKACRPFDAGREGTVLSEGAGFLVMETLDHAARRGARIYAEILGYGSSLDAFRVTDPEPSGRGAVLSMRRAIADSGLMEDEVASINAHGTGTVKNDVAETLALKEVFGGRASGIPVTANKSMTGHMIAASGAVEAASSILTLFFRKLPPTINLETRDPQCDLDVVTGSRDFQGSTVLSNSFGFGGQNATLIFSRFEA